MPVRCNWSKKQILIILIFQAGFYHQVPICDKLPVYIYHTDSTFLNKTGLFHAFKSQIFRIPIWITKYIKMNISFSEALWTLHVLLCDPQTTFHSPVCTILITLAVLPQRSDIRLSRYPPVNAPCSAFFCSFCVFYSGITRVKSNGGIA